MEGFYTRAGANLGNLLFTNAVWRQIAWRNAEQAFYFNPAYANDNFDCVVIPAANWLYSGFDLSALADCIEGLRIPAIMIGIGAQAGKGAGIPEVSESGLRLVKAVSERSALIGARGEFSADVLRHYGIRNVQVTGCPSLYFNTNPQPEVIKGPTLRRLILASTRYYLDQSATKGLERIQQTIYKLGLAQEVDMLYQSERPELDLLVTGKESAIEETAMARLIRYYGADSREHLLHFLRTHGRCFLDVDQWRASMREYDLYVGSRVHGAIAALSVGTPAILLAHDSRTSELADFSGIPSVSLREVDGLTLESIERLYAETSWDKYVERNRVARKDYGAFLTANGLSHWITA